YVVTNVLFTTDLALWTAVGLVVVFAALWYVLPLVGSSSAGEKAEEEQEPSGDGQPQESRGASSRR
ncbi:MAG TPA: hypothetical protein VG846_16495, partial [Actinomycetota bacterium]|nr:hypothetical protein [Actinomycetota bacterium]